MNEELYSNLASDYILGFSPLCLTFGGDAMDKTYFEVYVHIISLLPIVFGRQLSN